MVHDIGGFIKTFSLLAGILKMWRIDIFIRHKCGKSKNIVGNRCTRGNY